MGEPVLPEPALPYSLGDPPPMQQQVLHQAAKVLLDTYFQKTPDEAFFHGVRKEYVQTIFRYHLPETFHAVNNWGTAVMTYVRRLWEDQVPEAAIDQYKKDHHGRSPPTNYFSATPFKGQGIYQGIQLRPQPIVLPAAAIQEWENTLNMKWIYLPLEMLDKQALAESKAAATAVNPIGKLYDKVSQMPQDRRQDAMEYLFTENGAAKRRRGEKPTRSHKTGDCLLHCWSVCFAVYVAMSDHSLLPFSLEQHHQQPLHPSRP